MEALAQGYSWFKAIHIIAVISWMAGLLYLPRLFVYHCSTGVSSVQGGTFKVMERRLYAVIMTPAMMVTWVFGVLLLFSSGGIDWQSQYWLHAKLFLVVCLTGFHFYLGAQVKLFATGGQVRSSSFYRAVNEIPTVIMVLVVILVVVKPF
jgi:protoporphyrinogen IX oxidase